MGTGTLVGRAVSGYVEAAANGEVPATKGPVEGEEEAGVDSSPVGKEDARAAEHIAWAAWSTADSVNSLPPFHYLTLQWRNNPQLILSAPQFSNTQLVAAASISA